ncbi:MAG: hypothetical protein LBN32_03785 [Helicobacteraceae bacterium]|nr:hypothetical protein [Helicobacteraceae bacterium]
MRVAAKKTNDRTWTLQKKREVAKTAASLSLGAVTLTGFMIKNSVARKAHVILGAALIGFVVWHHLLYPQSTDTAK